jgi:hypothetical protein
MSHDEAAMYHSNGYNAQAACEHCDDYNFQTVYAYDPLNNLLTG